MSNINLQKQAGQQEINVNMQEQQAPVFAPMQDMQQIQQQKLEEENKKRQAAKEMKERMKALKSMVSYNKAMHCPSKTALKGEYGRTFKSSVSDKKRSAAMENHRSRLFKKRANAKTLSDIESAVAAESMQKMSDYIDKNGIPALKDIMVDVAAFVTDKESYHSKEIIHNAFGEGEEHEGRNMTKAMDHMLAVISDTELKNIRLDNDAELVAHAGEMERLSWQIAAFDRMNERFDYINQLDNATKKVVEQKLEAVRSIARYYKLRKEIINDPAYQSRYNDELSMDFTSARNEEEKAIGKKLYAAFLAGKEMLRLNGASESLIRKQGEPVFAKKKEQEEFKNRQSMDSQYVRQDMLKDYGNSEIVRKAEEKLRTNKTVKKQLVEGAIQRLDDYKGDIEKRPGYEEEPYDESKMNKYCAELYNINMSDFKIESYWDMTESFYKNYDLCEKAERLNREIVRGLTRGWKGPGENMLISLRAKVRAIDSIKKTICLVNGALATIKGSADYTDEQWENYLKEELKVKKESGYPFFVLKPGMAEDLYKKYREVFDEEDETKEQSIKDVYSLLVSTGEDDEIPPEELEERKSKYNKNAFVQDWLSRDTVKPGLGTVSGAITNYMRNRWGKEIHASRTFEAISAGKSAEDVKGLYHLATGNAEKQLQYYMMILDTVFEVPLKEFNTDDLGSFFDNWAKKEVAGRLTTDNIMEVGRAVKELLDKNPRLKLPEKYGNIDELLIKTEALHHHGCAFTGGRIDALQQIKSTKYSHALSLADLGSYDSNKMKIIDDRMFKIRNEVVPFMALGDPNAEKYDIIDALFQKIDTLNIADEFHELSSKEMREGKQRRLTFGADVEVYYQKYLEKEIKKRSKQKN